ncbi:J domain-containing protein [Desulfosoma caldarium]|uniref:DnaJ-like protein n=1 Tax=Desulfosoma caldarium TaxID=610254 RepID=A0A3N1UHM0_9BACT|nr:DnaJ domain-containing protein [Desulfosoma caldarium]ROQ90754.1 DnaJ-like protein [Desulfosoma caldarium]
MAVPEQATSKDYQLLGLQPGASIDDVKRAYREMAKKWHPDRYSDAPPWARLRAEEKFKDLQEAYQRIVRGPLPSGPGSSEATSARQSGGFKQASSPGPGTRSSKPIGAFSRSSLNTLGRWAGFGAVVAMIALWAVWALRLEGPIPWERRSAKKPKAPMIQNQEAAKPMPLQFPSRPQHLLSSPSKAPVPDVNLDEPWPPHAKVPLQTEATFGLGSTERDVLRAQGPPDRRSAGRWTYGLSEVRFQDGRVVGYDNFDGRLRVLVKPTRAPEQVEATGFFTLGSSRDEVLRVQGTPTAVRGSVWHYGFSSVRFVEDRVAAYDNAFGNLKVRLLPSHQYLDKMQGVPPSFFTIGSSTDEVLAVQGTPTSVRGNMWFYDFANVLFRNGRVGWVSDPQNRLRFVEKEALAQRAMPERQ